MQRDELIDRTIANKYRIESFLGGGGMGAVYKARQIDLDKTVAVKVLHQEFALEAAFVARFKREAKAASRIDHPNSMRVLDFGSEPDGLLYIVMEFLDGKSLYEILHREAPLEPERITEIFRQALAALAAAHDLGIVHRDIKPDNIVVLQRSDDEGVTTEQVKVCDFGIAKFTESSQSTSAEKLTTDGTIIGTPDYLSPEQARSDNIDARSDLYSMGVILFEALTGKIPFKADTPLGVVLQHLDAEPPRPSSMAPGVDPKLEAICLRCLKKDPADRYPSAREMRAAFAPESMRPSSGGSDPGVKIPRAPRVPMPAPAISEVSPTAITSPQLTPPPVSSTPAPVPLLLTKKASSEPKPRPRLASVTEEPAPSSMTGILLAAFVTLATAGICTWVYRSGSHGASAASAAPPPASAASASAPAAPPPPDSAPVAPPSSPATPMVELSDAGVSFAATVPGAPPANAGKGKSKTPPSTARVVVGSLRASGVAPAEILRVLPGKAIADCYGAALAEGGFGGKGTLHFVFTLGATKSSFGGEPAVGRLADCIDGAGQTALPQAVTSGSADVDLVFLPK